MLVRKKPGRAFRVTFERLEGRELMAADLTAYSSAAFLSSAATGADGSSNQQLVGSLYLRVSTAQHKQIAPVAPKAPPSPAPAPVAPVAPVTVAPVTSPVTTVDWFSNTLHDVALRDLTRNDARDGLLSRADMLGIFGQVERDGTVSAAEFADLNQIVGKSSFFVGLDYVSVLAGNVIKGNVANAHYQGQGLGNLATGSSGGQLDKLVHKWFLGDDHPTTMAGVSYQNATGSLFPHTPTYTDVKQGQVGDCYFVGSLGEAALKDPSLIQNMFIVNGDGSYTVRFYHNGTPDYVTVDSKLPVDARGNYVYANYGLSSKNGIAPLWVALAEKAYVQMDESGWLRANLGDHGGNNSYAAISGGYMTDALNQISNRRGVYGQVNAASFLAAYNAGQLITFGSFSKPVDSSVIGNHAYAVISYNQQTQQVTLFNPWGINNGWAPGLVTLSWNQMKNDFSAMQYTA